MSFSSGLLAAVSNNDQTRRLALLNNACRDVTIRADSSRAAHPNEPSHQSQARSITFGTDRSLRHRVVSSDPISQPQTKSPSIHHPHSRAPLVSLVVSLRPALPCPVLSCPVLPCHFDSQALLSLLLCCTTTATTTTTTTTTSTQLQPTCIASPIAHPLSGTSLVRWLDSAAHPRIPPHR